MNFSRKSTVGWSIGNILLDLVGGVLNFGQMGVQSIDQSKSLLFSSFFFARLYNLYLGWDCQIPSFYQ